MSDRDNDRFIIQLISAVIVGVGLIGLAGLGINPLPWLKPG